MTSKRYPRGVPVRHRFDAARLRLDMDKAGIGVEELAAKAGRTAATVWNFLAGRFQSSATNAKLARALGKSPARYVIDDRR